MNEDQGSQMTVTINDHRYDPAEITVPEGAEIRFKNEDEETHSVTSAADGFDLELDPGESESIDFPNAGTFDYYCRYHPEMKGTIMVEQQMDNGEEKKEGTDQPTDEGNAEGGQNSKDGEGNGSDNDEEM